jgi:hypothetical protein
MRVTVEKAKAVEYVRKLVLEDGLYKAETKPDGSIWGFFAREGDRPDAWLCISQAPTPELRKALAKAVFAV